MSASSQRLHYPHRFSTVLYIALVLLTSQLDCAFGLLCYSCTSTQPGCTLDKVDWLIHSATSCPNDNDKCVKIIESRGADLRVTRGCLSEVMPYRRDIPADHYEGCRPATSNPARAVYVFNEQKELDLKASTYNNVTYCFCEFDHWCNSARTVFHRGTVTTLIAGAMLLSALVNGVRGW